MIIFLILEHSIAKWYSYQPSIIISNPSPSVIHHHHISIIFKESIIITYRSSSVIHHHHISIIFIHPSSSNIDHLQSSIIIKYQRNVFFGRMLGFSVRGSCWWIWMLVIWARIWGRPELAFHISLITIHDAQ